MCLSFVFAASGCFLTLYSPELKYILPLLLFIISVIYVYPHPQRAFVVSTFAFGISHIIHGIASFIISFVIFSFYGIQHAFSYNWLAVFAIFLQATLIYVLFKVKRLKGGIRFLLTDIYINFTTVLCLFFISLTTYFKEYRLIGLLSVFVTFAFLIYWWQAQITKAYRRKLELRELESLRTEVTELNLLIDKLTKENERLARITHRDNTLITTLKNSTISYLSTDFRNPAEAIATRDRLISNITALSAERTSLPLDSHTKEARCFDTGLSLLDELLGHMNSFAMENHITFSVHLATMLTDFVPKDISENDLVHTVDDLLKNAFKATTTCQKRCVQLQFYKLGKYFVVEVADNGIPFELNSLVNMGLEKITTYADGSGIGLVDIWITKEKYGATYHLDECTNHASFTKKISMTFDKKNLYSIRTGRKEEILQISKRTDLQVYDYTE